MARRSFAPALRALLSPESKSLIVPATSVQPAGLEQKTVIIGGAYTSTTLAGGGYSSSTEDRAAGYDLDTVIIDGYEQVVWVYKSVEFISGHFSRLPFVIGKERGTEQEEVLDDHPLYRVLNKQANPLETGRVFRKRLSAQVLLSKKGAFVEVTKSRMGTITRLDLLPPNRVRPVPDPDGNYLLHFEFTERNGNVREIAPERIRWVRDPHPTDPFSGVTPLDPSGASVELDRLYRTYNSAFIKNDARPGGIVGVDADTLSDEEMRRVESRFAPGAHSAGLISIIATGPGGLKYLDTTTRPRDMAYGEASENAKVEILSAFGLGESLFGNAAGRTFDNAEQERYNAWSETLVPHFDLITSAFDRDVDEEWDPYIDTKTVDVLELPRRKKREEARTEVEQGLRSVNEYRPLSGLDEIDNAYARALWISPSKAPIPQLPEDAAALGLADPTAPPAEVDESGNPIAPAGPEALTAGAGATDAAGAVAEARALADPTAAGAVAAARGLEAGAPIDDGSAEGAVAAARAGDEGGDPGEAAAAVEEARGPLLEDLEGKALTDTGPGQVEYAPTDDEARRAELAITAALDALLTRQQSVLIARLESPKTRKGTRFWQPGSADDVHAGAEPIDVARVIDEARWVQETTETLQPLVDQYAVGAAAALLTAFAAGGVVASAPSPTESAAEFAPEAAQATSTLVLGMVTAAGEAMREWLNDVGERLAVGQLTAATIDDLTVTVRSFYSERVRVFSESLALSVAQGTVNGAHEAAAAALTAMPEQDGRTVGITREWMSRRDDRVRPSHKAVDGTELPVGQPFLVGGFLLRYPNDPLAPAAETRGCRCRAHYRTVKSARFLLPPTAE